MSDTYCKRIDYETIIRGFNDNGEIALCCKSQHPLSLRHSNLQDLEKVKQDLQDGIKHEHCTFCWTQEAAGDKSWRQIGNEQDFDYNTVELYMNNTCDLACIYCSPKYSSNWEQEVNHAGEDTGLLRSSINDFEFVPRKEKYDHVPKSLDIIEHIGKTSNAPVQIILLGGEPLLTPFVKKGIINDIIEAFYKSTSDDAVLKLGIVTNANTPDAIIDKAILIIDENKKKHPNLEVFLSISLESTGANAEYVRHGLDFERFDKNLTKWMGSGNNIMFSMAVNNVSWFDTLNFFEYAFSKAKEFGVLINFRFNVVMYPKHLSISMLPNEYEYVFDDILDCYEKNDHLIHGGITGRQEFKKQVNHAKSLFATEVDNIEYIKKACIYFDYIKRKRNKCLSEVCTPLYNMLFSNSNKLCYRADAERILKLNTGKIYPCAKNAGVDLLNGDINKLVEDIQKGLEPKECSACFGDNADKPTYRELGNQTWGDPLHGNSHTEIYIDNDCNSACIYCNRYHSSTWESEISNSRNKVPAILAGGDISNNNLTPEKKQRYLDHVKEIAQDPRKHACIGIYGGEPTTKMLETNDMGEIVEHFYKHAVLNNGRRNLRYDLNTSLNFDSDKCNKIIDYLLGLSYQYEDLDIIIQPSFESIKENFNFVRYGNDWKQAHKNMLLFLTRTNFKIEIKSQVSNVALCDLKNFLEYINKLSKRHRPIKILLGIVSAPQLFHVGVLSDKFREHLKEVYDFIDEVPLHFENTSEIIEGVHHIKAMLGIFDSETKSKLARQALEVYKYFEKERGIQLNKVNPELYDYFENISEN